MKRLSRGSFLREESRSLFFFCADQSRASAQVGKGMEGTAGSLNIDAKVGRWSETGRAQRPSGEKGKISSFSPVLALRLYSSERVPWARYVSA